MLRSGLLSLQRVLAERTIGNQMDRLQFAVPVRVTTTQGMPIEEIYGVEQALDFLAEWPVGRQGKLYQAAFDACFAATVDIVPTEDACRAFKAFCRVSKLLAADAASPANRRRNESRPSLPS
jgi:hypothetical protein